LARYSGPVCRLCRREGMKLFLKGERCFKPSCAIEKRNYIPGEHGRDRRPKKIVGYGLQLREKQKVKRMYGILEKQFHLYFKRAVRQKGVTGEILLSQLERRLDNVVLRLGLAVSHAQARQFVRHGHVRVNTKKVNIPSFLVRLGDEIAIKEKSRKNVEILNALDVNRGMPPWLELDRDGLNGKVLALPKREDISMPIEEHMIVELYSK
jgi:small subunit ribosomal protein S4